MREWVESSAGEQSSSVLEYTSENPAYSEGFTDSGNTLIVTVGGMQNTLEPRWQNDLLLGWLNHGLSACLYSCICPTCASARSVEIIAGKSVWLRSALSCCACVPCYSLFKDRSDIRRSRHIGGTAIEDWACSLLCPFLVASQHFNEGVSYSEHLRL